MNDVLQHQPVSQMDCECESLRKKLLHKQRKWEGLVHTGGLLQKNITRLEQQLSDVRIEASLLQTYTLSPDWFNLSYAEWKKERESWTDYADIQGVLWGTELVCPSTVCTLYYVSCIAQSLVSDITDEAEQLDREVRQLDGAVRQLQRSYKELRETTFRACRWYAVSVVVEFLAHNLFNPL